MRSARVAEWILSQVLAPDRAASMIGDWLEDAAARGRFWFWSCVFRTLLSHVWTDFTERPGFMVGLAIRGWLYSLWLLVGTYFGLFVAVCILVPLVLFAGFLAHQIHWHPSWPFHLPTQIFGQAIIQLWIAMCEFQAGRWIAHRAPGRELAAGTLACLIPWAVFFPLGLLAEPGPASVPTMLPSELFLLAGILWSRHKSIRSVAP